MRLSEENAVASHVHVDTKSPKIETSYRLFDSGGYIEIFPSSVSRFNVLFFNSCYGVRIASTGDFAYGLTDPQSLAKTPHYTNISLSTRSFSSCQPLKYTSLCVTVSIWWPGKAEKILLILGVKP